MIYCTSRVNKKRGQLRRTGERKREKEKDGEEEEREKRRDSPLRFAHIPTSTVVRGLIQKLIQFPIRLSPIYSSQIYIPYHLLQILLVFLLFFPEFSVLLRADAQGRLERGCSVELGWSLKRRSSRPWFGLGWWWWRDKKVVVLVKSTELSDGVDEPGRVNDLDAGVVRWFGGFLDFEGSLLRITRPIERAREVSDRERTREETRARTNLFR